MRTAVYVKSSTEPRDRNGAMPRLRRRKCRQVCTALRGRVAQGTAHLCDAVLCWRVNTRDCCDDAPSSLGRGSSGPPEPDGVSSSASAALLCVSPMRPKKRTPISREAAGQSFRGRRCSEPISLGMVVAKSLVLVCNES